MLLFDLRDTVARTLTREREHRKRMKQFLKLFCCKIHLFRWEFLRQRERRIKGLPAARATKSVLLLQTLSCIASEK